VIRNGVADPPASTSWTVVSALIAVPPIPAPKIPIASPRRCGGNQALTNGTPTANAVPPMPRKNPPTSSAGYESWPASPMNRTGTTVAAEISGNITRPPNRSVSAPTGMRPTAPTTTGTATSSACCAAVSPRDSLKRGPRGRASGWGCPSPPPAAPGRPRDPSSTGTSWAADPAIVLDAAPWSTTESHQASGPSPLPPAPPGAR
jgi:hypothetical protein